MRKSGKVLLQEQQQYERQAKSLRLTYDKVRGGGVGKGRGGVERCIGGAFPWWR